MPALRSIFRRLCAALSFFTRLPFWRLARAERRDYERVVPLWPLAGWLTGGMVALLCWAGLAAGLPARLSVLLAVAGRLLLTGGLHEDGLADFFDGFGGGRDREQTLRIMKDSRIGTYGVLALLLYVLLLCETMTGLVSRGVSPLVFWAADAFAKCLASTLIRFLPYARGESEAKNGLVYASVSGAEWAVCVVAGMLPLLLFMLFSPIIAPGWMMFPAGLSLILLGGLVSLMRRRIGGYTGDCCGATFLMLELAFLLGLLVIQSICCQR